MGFKFQSWIVPQRLLASAYPMEPDGLASLADQGIAVVVNLHERAHSPAQLADLGLTEVHVPVPDLTAPSLAQLVTGVEAISTAMADGQGVAVHCAAGLGRTGTLVACYLVSTGLDASVAIARVREARPGSVETAAQEAAVEAFARRRYPCAGLGLDVRRSESGCCGCLRTQMASPVMRDRHAPNLPSSRIRAGS